MIYPLLPAFVTRTLGGSATMLAALDGAADLASAATNGSAGISPIDQAGASR